MKSTYLALVLALLLSGCVNYELLGDDAVRTGDYDEAIEYYETAAVEDPANPHVKTKLADAKVRAADDFYARGQKALAQRNPARAIEYLSAALGWDRRPEIQAALDEAKRLLKVVTGERFAAQGHEYRLGKGLNKAQGLFRKALDHDPGNASARDGLAQVVAEIKRLTPLVTAAQRNLKAKKWAKAVEGFDEVLAGWSDNRDAVAGKRLADNHVAYDQAVARARRFEQAHDWDGAWKAYLRAQGIYDSKSIRTLIARSKGRADSVSLTEVGRGQLEAKALTSAQRTLRQALKLYRGNAVTTELLAKVGAERRQAAALFTRADAARTASRWQEALDLYEGGLAIWADHRQAAAHLAVCGRGRDHDSAIALGDKAFAQANWGLALEHYQDAMTHMQSQVAKSRIQRARNFRRCDALTVQALEAIQATNLTKAQALLAEILSLNPAHAKAASLQGEIRGQTTLVQGLIVRGGAAEHAHRWDEALDLYVAAQRLWADNPTVAEGLAICAAGQAVAHGDAAADHGDWADAAKHYGDALQTVDSPDTRKAFARASYMHHFNVGEAHQSVGEARHALAAYELAATHEQTAEVMRRIGALEQVLRHEGEHEEPEHEEPEHDEH